MRLELLFPIHLRETMKNLEKLQDLEEIRVRIGQPLFFYTGQKELVLLLKEKQDKKGQFRNSRELGTNDNVYHVT